MTSKHGIQQPKHVSIDASKLPPESRVEWREFSPEECRRIVMDHNPNNRTLSEAVSSGYAREMREGRWDEHNGQTIVMTPGGDIIDGQHRMWAAVLAGLPLRTFVVTTRSERAFATLDQHSRRTAAAVCQMAGIAPGDTYRAVAAARIVLACRRFVLPKSSGCQYAKTKFSAAYLLDMIPHMEGLEPMLDIATKDRAVPTPLVGVCAWLYEHNRTKATEFAHGTMSGANLAADDARFHLRNRVFMDPLVRRERNLVVAFSLHAWNRWTKGESVAQLKLPPGDEARFPDRVAFVDRKKLEPKEASDE